MSIVSSSLTRSMASLDLALDPNSRAHRLRRAYWERRHYAALAPAGIDDCGEDTLLGYATNFANLLAASAPQIAPDELIVGSSLAYTQLSLRLKLGVYDAHYPPGFATLLAKGLAGIRDEAHERLASETDPDKRAFLSAVEISYAAAVRYVAAYAGHARALAVEEPDPVRRGELCQIAAICDELATGLPTTFHAALQLVQFARLFGGRGCIGRFDQWLAPFLQRDLASGAITREEALELVECFFVKLNEFASGPEREYEARLRGGVWGGASNDTLRNIVLAGQTPAGDNACNDLTYLCLEASGKLMLPEPKINVRFFEGSPDELLPTCCQVVARGGNVLAFFNDNVALPALLRLGIPPEDARDYCCDGCSELIIGGKGTIWFHVFDSLTVLTDLARRATTAAFPTFEALLAALKDDLAALMVDGPGEDQAVTWPFFAATIEDCLAKASPTGARYSIRGSILAQVGNTADGLAAIRKLIYEDRAVTLEALATALADEFEGHEVLRQMILHRAPKYGNDADAVDGLVREIAEFWCSGVLARAHNLPGPGPKRAPGLMCFALEKKRELPASPDGRRQGDPTANSFSPAIGMDRSGPTAVLKSASKVDLSLASHGSLLDIALHASVMRGEEDLPKLAALVQGFLDLPCTATLALNVIDRETLLRAQANPTAEEFKTIIVRVWGFSAVFVDLPATLQDHVLARTEHGSL